MQKELFYCDLNPEKTCENCNECDICDLNSNKLCDNCGKCIGLDGSDYSRVIIEGILDSEEELEEYVFENDNPNLKNETEIEAFNEYDYIEDIPELRDEYERKVAAILSGNDIDTECSHDEEDECDCCHDHS